MKHFAILSSGCYSDYSPRYFMGDYPLTSEELERKAKEIGDLVIAEFLTYPVREHVCEYDWCCSSYKKDKWEKYNPETGKRIYSVDSSRWNTLMEEYLHALGFEELPDEIPEINIEYSDVPHN